MPMIGAWRTRVELFDPVTADTPDGGYTESYVALDPPALDVGMRPAGPRDLERLTAGTVTATQIYALESWWHPGVSTKTIVTLQGAAGERVLSVLYVGNPDGQGTYMDLLCAERVA